MPIYHWCTTNVKIVPDSNTTLNINMTFCEFGTKDFTVISITNLRQFSENFFRPTLMATKTRILLLVKSVDAVHICV